MKYIKEINREVEDGLLKERKNSEDDLSEAKERWEALNETK